MRDVQRQLSADQEQIEYSLQYLCRLVTCGGALAALHVAWVRLEVSLLDRLAAEERHLFAFVAQAHRGGIEALRAEHEQIRRHLMELGLSVDLGAVTIQEIAALRAVLAAHLAHEEASLYPWLEESRDRAAQRAVSVVLQARAPAITARARAVTLPAIPSLLHANLAR